VDTLMKRVTRTSRDVRFTVTMASKFEGWKMKHMLEVSKLYYICLC
jgi:hypothetical protein